MSHMSYRENHMRKILAVFILFSSVGSMFSMDWDTCPRNMEEQANRRMAELVDMAIDDHIIADSSEIHTVATQCFNTFGKDFLSAFQAFTYQVPGYDKIPEISREYITSLSEHFHEALRLISESQ